MITGMQYLPNFIGEDEERDLIATIDYNEWSLDLKRRTQHYGYKYDYTKKKVDSSLYLGYLPIWLDSIVQRLIDQKIFEVKPDQVIINEYLPGQGISRHVDCVPCFGDTIASLSLSSTCSMQFENLSSAKRFSLILDPLSLLVLKEESRYEWMHSIPARKEDPFGEVFLKRTRRISLTFRTIKYEKEKVPMVY